MKNENTNSRNKIDDMKEQENYKTNSQQLFAEVLKKMGETHLKKNHDYGNSFNKSLDEFGEVAAMIRISDKINRLKTLLNKKAEVSDESLDDTIMDCANYLVMWRVYRMQQSQKIMANSGVTTSPYNCTDLNNKLP